MPPDQVWALDTTYIPMAKGFVYLTAVVDWASRKVLASKVAITLEACHAVDVLQDAFNRYGTAGNRKHGSRQSVYGYRVRNSRSGSRLQTEHGWSWGLARTMSLSSASGRQ